MKNVYDHARYELNKMRENLMEIFVFTAFGNVEYYENKYYVNIRNNDTKMKIQCHVKDGFSVFSFVGPSGEIEIEDIPNNRVGKAYVLKHIIGLLFLIEK